VNNVLTDDPAFTIAISAASIHHAVTSSAAAQVMAMAPSLVRVRFLSCKMRASTGKAVMLMAIPINNAKDEKEIAAGANSLYM